MDNISALLEKRKGNLEEVLKSINELQGELYKQQEQALVLKGAVAQLEEIIKDDEEPKNENEEES